MLVAPALTFVLRLIAICIAASAASEQLDAHEAVPPLVLLSPQPNQCFVAADADAIQLIHIDVRFQPPADYASSHLLCAKVR